MTRSVPLRSLGIALASTLAWGGCSAVINPDTTLLGDPVDAGPGIVLVDGGPRVDAGDRDAGARMDADRPGVDGGPMRDAGGCVASCAEGVLRNCMGGEITCMLGCAPGGEPRCLEMIPSNVAPDLWRSDAPTVDLAGDGRFGFDTDACNSTMAMSQIVSQGDGSQVCVFQVRTLRIRSGATLRAVGENPLVIMAFDDVQIDDGGTLDVSTYGSGDAAQSLGAGGTLGSRPARAALGISPGRDGVHTTGTYEDGGGGGGGFCGAGGAGGNGGTEINGGMGGGIALVNLLIPLVGGSSGGFGAGNLVGTSTVGLGGGGGGAVQISARGSITVNGAILAGGGGGRGGLAGVTSLNWGSGGGGGSGGAILLEAPMVVVTSTATVSTTGGAGAGSASGSPGDDGEDGARLHDPAAGGRRGGNQYGADGADSGGGTRDEGNIGGSNTGGSGNGGGGGGGVGCVVLR
ncbi:MAG: hypothetical protein AB7P00_18815, partial [Sandaracinaceae bacterium]